MLENRFETRAPSAQTALDIFSGRWASEVGEVLPGVSTGGFKMFREDKRPRQAAAALGLGGMLTGMRILELGPLEGAHSYQLQQMGAEIVGVEANAEAYLKSLILKDHLGMDRVKFMFGDFIQFMDGSPQKWDMVFCSGVLYHMSDPLNLIRLVAEAADKCFVWTHYYDEGKSPVERVAHPVDRFGLHATYHEAVYPDRAAPRFWGGNQATACWMKLDDILAGLRHFGLDPQVIETGDSPHGPWVTLAATR